jgi:hypothetical protein
MRTSFPEFPRILRSGGTPYETGFQTGQQLGPALSAYIDAYLSSGPFLRTNFDHERHSKKSLSILSGYTERFCQECEGLAAGAGIPLKKVAEWIGAEACMIPQCSGFLLQYRDKTWIGRNNDLWSPHLWGYALKRKVKNRIPILTFGLAGDIFSATGLNDAGLWLHYNYLKAPDRDKNSASAHPCYSQLVEMLETCETWEDISAWLARHRRPDGMMLFVSDWRNARHGIFECTCYNTIYRPLEGEGDLRFLVGTNHYTQPPYDNSSEPDRADSISRYHRLETRLRPFCTGKISPEFPSLKAILSDAGVEKRNPDYGTVYANLYCPERQELWYTFGGYPAASLGRWDHLPQSTLRR